MIDARGVLDVTVVVVVVAEAIAILVLVPEGIEAVVAVAIVGVVVVVVVSAIESGTISIKIDSLLNKPRRTPSLIETIFARCVASRGIPPGIVTNARNDINGA